MTDVCRDLSPHSPRYRTMSSTSHRLGALHHEHPVPVIRLEHERPHSMPVKPTPSTIAGRPRRFTEPAEPTPHPFSAAACAQRAQVTRAMGSEPCTSPTRTVSAPGALRTNVPEVMGPVPMAPGPAAKIHAAPASPAPVWSPPPVGSAERAIICPFEPQWLVPPLPIKFPSTLSAPAPHQDYAHTRQSRAERSKSTGNLPPPPTQKRAWFRRRI